MYLKYFEQKPFFFFTNKLTTLKQRVNQSSKIPIRWALCSSCSKSLTTARTRSLRTGRPLNRSSVDFWLTLLLESCAVFGLGVFGHRMEFISKCFVRWPLISEADFITRKQNLEQFVSEYDLLVRRKKMKSYGRISSSSGSVNWSYFACISVIITLFLK